jgi:CDP-paratose 2-epimerase
MLNESPPLEGRVLITGGAGLIGTHLADRLAAEGRPVRLLDDLSRPGAELNAAWLVERHPGRVEAILGDVRKRSALRTALREVDHVVHLAARVGVTAGFDDPATDHDVNLRGSFNLLEAVRACDPPPSLVFASTHKVYGGLGDVELRLAGERVEPEDVRLRHRGIDENRPLAPCTPHGCSKAAADLYALDYARSFRLRTAVVRLGSIYGERQLGIEEEPDWVAHLLLGAALGEPITLYGDGRQVRDLLHVDDLVEALSLLENGLAHGSCFTGRAFNLGGGPANTVSLLELVGLIGRLHGSRPEVVHADRSRGDQRYYVSDTSAFRTATGWRPRVSVWEGLGRLDRWLRDNHPRFIEDSASDFEIPPSSAPDAPIPDLGLAAAAGD